MLGQHELRGTCPADEENLMQQVSGDMLAVQVHIINDLMTFHRYATSPYILASRSGNNIVLYQYSQ